MPEAPSRRRCRAGERGFDHRRAKVGKGLAEFVYFVHFEGARLGQPARFSYAASITLSPEDLDVPNLSDEEVERSRNMSIDEKFAEIGRLNQLETERQRAEIRARHGDISEEEMRWRVAALRYGRELIAKALGWDPDAAEGNGNREGQASSKGEDSECLSSGG